MYNFVSKNNLNEYSKNEIITHVTKICDTIDSLGFNIDKINQKIDNISKLFYQLSYNSSLPSTDTSSYLKFQIQQLKNEKSYFTNIKKSLKEKLVTDTYSISESILMLLGSIENIKIDQETEKINILKKIFPLKKLNKQMETSELLELTNSTLHNLELINDFVKVFDYYIQETITRETDLSADIILNVDNTIMESSTDPIEENEEDEENGDEENNGEQNDNSTIIINNDNDNYNSDDNDKKNMKNM